ncbi:MAG: hypothetical protein DDT23_00623 [candidate division WS2 bacterium]|nr:hypothetical protein [Candidatus Lithacetigena glycinireducens]
MITFDRKDFKKVDFGIGDTVNITITGTVSNLDKDLVLIEPTSIVSERVAIGEEVVKSPVADEEIPVEEEERVPERLRRTPTIEEIEEGLEEEERRRRK